VSQRFSRGLPGFSQELSIRVFLLLVQKIVFPNKPFLDFERPMHVPDVVRRCPEISLSEAVNDVLVFSRGTDFPFLDEAPEPWKIVQPLFENLYRMNHFLVYGKIQIHVVKGEVFFVEEWKIVLLQGLAHFFVQSLHVVDVLDGDEISGAVNSLGFQGSDNLVKIPDFFQSEDIYHNAFAGKEGDESFGFQVEQSVPKGGFAHSQIPAQFVKVEKGAGLDFSRIHFMTQKIVNVLTQGLYFRNRAYGHGNLIPPFREEEFRTTTNTYHTILFSPWG
jgi:hypothetical protein